MSKSRDTRGSKETARELVRRLEKLREKRRPFDPIYDDVAELMGPAYKGFNAKVDHPRRPDPTIVDATARRAAASFSAGMLSGMSSPSTRWFTLTTGDKDLDAFPRVRGWLQALEDDFYDTLSRSYYYPQQHLAYHQTGLFGWQCMYLDESPTAGIRFNARPLSEVYVEENFQGLVDTVFRVFELSARQAAQKWGEDALSKTTRELLADADRDRDRPVAFLHAVLPRQDMSRSPLAPQAKAYASFYLELAEEHVVAESGYHEMPYLISRFHKLPGTPYSYSPGTEALADVQMINEMKRLILEAGQLAVAPPYLLPDDGFLGRFSYEPRALNYYRKTDQMDARDFQPLPVGGDPRFGMELLAATRQDINEAFFVDLFQMIRQRTQMGSTPTAREVAELSQEKMFLLGPMLVRQQRENFDALFDRLFQLKWRLGQVPPPPPELAGRDLKAEYVSPLALAQREHVTRAVMQTYADVLPITQVAPEVLDVFDHEENVRRIARQRGFPQTGLKTREEVAAARQARAEQMAAMQQQAALGQVADKLPALSKAPEQGSPAQALIKAATGGE